MNLEQNGWLTSDRGQPQRPQRPRLQRPRRQQRRRRLGGGRAGRPAGSTSPLAAGRRDGLRRRAPVRVELGRRPDAQPPAGRRPGLLLRQPLPRPPGRAIGFTAAMGAFEGADDLLLETMDGASTGPDGDHLNNANMFTPPNGSHPRMQMYLWSSPFRQHLQRQRRGDPLPRVHARALEPARHRRRRLRRAELRPGGRDGGGLERLVRAGLHRRPVPGAGHRRRGRGQDGRLHRPHRVLLEAALLAAGLPAGRRRPDRLPGADHGRLGRVHLRRLRAHRRRRRGPRRRRDLGADPLGPAHRGGAREGARAGDDGDVAAGRPSPPSWTRATGSSSPIRRSTAAPTRTRCGACSPGAGWASSPRPSTATTPRRRRASRCRRRPAERAGRSPAA